MTTSTENIHVRSFREFIYSRLPAALAAVLPLCDYRAEETGDGAGRITLCLPNSLQIAFDGIPFPRPDGSFLRYDTARAVPMTATTNNLEEAEIEAVGEQLMDEIGPRLVSPPQDIEWDEATVRAWLPLDRWMRDFLLEDYPSSQWLDVVNPLAATTHLRRIRITGPDVTFHPSQTGRVCPFETPEGPMCGRILTLARGADVREGRVVPAEDREVGALGITASLVPFLCHNDSNRQLMAVNMMRQWLPQEPPEAPLVQTGFEPEDGGGSLGRNYLTAYLHWKGMTDEDAIVLSQSAAARLGMPTPLEVGDKLSNRHGSKGVVGAVLPDDEMPHLPDGRAVDLVFDSIAMHTRLNFGQVLEGLFGLIAEKRGKPIVASPFERTTSEELHAALRQAGLPESGQFALHDGKNGPALDEPTTVGIVYWGKTVHVAIDKIHALGADPERSFGRTWHGEEWRAFLGQRSCEHEYRALRVMGAHENVIDAYYTRSIVRPDGAALTAAVAAGFLPTRPDPPSAEFQRVRRALRTVLIDLEFTGSAAKVSSAQPTAADLPLAESVPHPWKPDVMLTHLGPQPAERELYDQVVAANERLAKALRAGVHAAALDAARSSLRRAVQALCDSLNAPRSGEWPFEARADVDSCAVRFYARGRFTGRSVLAPGYDLRLGEVGLPADFAWTLYSPLVAAQASESDLNARTPKAWQAVEALMKESVVVVNRAPTWDATSIVAFIPVIAPGRSIRLHPLCCRMFNGDFDGDQAAVWLPVSKPAQDEAKQKLTLIGHLKRDPGVVVYHLAPSNSVMVGLAYAAGFEEGRAELSALWPGECAPPIPPLTRAGLVASLTEVMQNSGPESLISLLEKLYAMGIAWATKSGSSLSPFVGESLRLPPPPASSYSASWSAYCAVVDAEIAAQADSDPTLRAPMRRIRCGARGSIQQLRALIGPWGVGDPYDPNPPITHGLRDGLETAELWQWTARARAALQQVNAVQDTMANAHRLAGNGTLLRRAMTSENPGQVFAEAAARNETDPLFDPDVRLWIGLLPLEE